MAFSQEQTYRTQPLPLPAGQLGGSTYWIRNETQEERQVMQNLGRL